jgi:hypothetical protein
VPPLGTQAGTLATVDPYVTLTVRLLDWVEYGPEEDRRYWTLLARVQYDLGGRVWRPGPGRVWRWRVWHPLCTDHAQEGTAHSRRVALDGATEALVRICQESVS